MVIISDTTTISNLFLIDRLWLLEKLYHHIILPKAVFEELERLEEDTRTIDAIRNAVWIEVMAVKNVDLVSVLFINLDKGEAEAIALAKELHADLLIIDELKGRKYAKQLKINVIGLVGILILAKQKGFIPSVKAILSELQEKAGFWISNQLLQTVMTLANES